MNPLASLQAQFQAYVLTGENEIQRAVVDGPRADAAARLNVYARGYNLRLIEVLDADYPALHVLAGDDLFDHFCRDYIAARPSVFPNARWFGIHLPDFLATRFAEQPVLAEMAAFEWAMSLAFDSADDPVLEIAALTQLPSEAWATLGFTLHRSLQRVELAWNVPAFWNAVEREDEPPIPQRSSATAPWMVWRRGLITFFRHLEADEAAALDAIRSAAGFADMCEVLCGWHTADQVPARAMALLMRWVDEGLLSGITPPLNH